MPRPKPGALAQAYGQGMDDRWALVAFADCPYKPSSRFHGLWQAGWLEVHYYYGADVNGRWPIRPLPDCPGIAPTK